MESQKPLRYTLGSVPYVNGRPLVWAFERGLGEMPVDVKHAIPSRLPAMLDSGEADAVLASSIESLLSPNRRIAGGIAIASDGAVESVRLFSKVPFGQIRRLALDQSSLTSNALAQILLRDRFGAQPEAKACPPDLKSMLAEFDAGVLIGDIGMKSDGTGLHILDLGQAWSEWTGLPFVWALWIGSERLTPELAGYLARARELSGLGAGRTRSAESVAQIVNDIAAVSGWTLDEVERYLTQVIGFDLTPRHLAGLKEFRQRLVAHGFAVHDRMPEIVEPIYSPDDPRLVEPSPA